MRPLAAAVLCVATLALVGPVSGRALAFDVAAAEREQAAIEARWSALTGAPTRDVKALAELDRRASALAADASRGLAAQREEAAERDADMAAVVAGHDWQATEALLLKLRLRIAAIELERALAGDADKARLARAAADGFAPFVDAPDPALAAEARYGRGLARIAAGDRADGIADLRAAAGERAVAGRARLALAETLAAGGDRTQALDVVGKLLASGGLSRDLTLRAKLLRLDLLLASGAKSAAASTELGALVSDLVAAGDPWRRNALALLKGREDLLPAGDAAGASVLLLRADAAARRDDAAGALVLYRSAVERGGDEPAPAALDGLARTALATGDWPAARGAVARLRATGQPWSRELALIDLRAAYGAWQAAPGDAAAIAALGEAADVVPRATGVTADDRAEAAYRKAEAARASGNLDAAIAGFAAIDAPAWQVAASVAALQGRVLRFAREPAREPRDVLLRDLAAALARDQWPADARATVVVLDATVRTTPPVAATSGKASASETALDPAQQQAALQRLRDFPKTYPASPALLPAVVRARVLLELDTGGKPDPATLVMVDEGVRPVLAAAVAAALREQVTLGARSQDPAARERTRRALDGALAFAALAPEDDRAAGRLELAQSALELGAAATAVTLFRAEAEAKPKSLRALRGLALAATAAGDAALARSTWDRLAAIPDLPPVVREEADRARGAAHDESARSPRPQS